MAFRFPNNNGAANYAGNPTAGGNAGNALRHDHIQQRCAGHHLDDHGPNAAAPALRLTGGSWLMNSLTDTMTLSTGGLLYQAGATFQGGRITAGAAAKPRPVPLPSTRP